MLIFASCKTFCTHITLETSKNNNYMETAEVTRSNVNHGQNIKIARTVKGIKQEVLAELMQVNQPTISKHENSTVLNDELLDKYAEALGVSVDFLKTWEEKAQTVVFESITNNDNAGAHANIGYAVTKADRATYQNPLDKVTELYERLLKEKDEKYSTLERRVQNLEKLLSDK